MRLVWTIAASLALFSPPAYSCSCILSGACPELGGKSGPVFLGTVLAVTDLPSSRERVFLTQRKARFRVDEAFGGLPSGAREVDLFTGYGGGDCGVPFEAGEKYLVDAFVGKDGLFHTSICSSTRRIEYAAVALRVLRQRRDGRRVPSLTGRIAQLDRSFNHFPSGHQEDALARTLVRVRSTDGRTYQAQADAGGTYEFYDLPPGNYEFDPDLPPDMTLSRFIGSGQASIRVEKRGSCQEQDIDVFAAGLIEGRVLDSSNQLVPHTSVYIVPAQEVLPEERQSYWESKVEEGYFRFAHIPPGRYLLVVNPDDAQTLDFPFAKTFYPGVHERKAAGVITVDAGGLVKNADIRLVQQFAPRHLTVRVRWADGRLIRDAVVVRAKGTVNPSAMSKTSQPDKKASVIQLSLLPNERYEVQAELVCRYADGPSRGPRRTLRSNVVRLSAREDQKEILLTMPGTACPADQGQRLSGESSPGR